MVAKFKLFKTIFVGLISVITVIYFARILSIGDKAITSNEDLQSTTVTPLLILVIVVLCLTVLSTLVVALLDIVNDTSKLMKIAISLVGLALVFFLSMAISSDENYYDFNKKMIADSDTSFWVGTFLNMFYILFIILLLSLGFSGLLRKIKK